MQFAEVVRSLEIAGTAQNRKTYARHGIPEPMYGCSFAHLKSVAKKIKHDQALAEQLWKTGNHDCRALAIMIADPAAMKLAVLNAWGREADNTCLAGMLGNLAAESPHALKAASAWCAAKKDLQSAAGWSTIAVLALADEDEQLDELFTTCLAAIEKHIHDAPNRTRQAMNGALIAVGGRNAPLKKLALAAAKRIGPVEVDHGDTDCQTPDAQAYIAKMWARKAEQGKKTPKRKRTVC